VSSSAIRVKTMADAIGTKQQGVSNVAVWFVHFPCVDGKIDAAVLPPEIPHRRQEAQRVALVVVFPANHVDSDKNIAVVMNKFVYASELILGIRQESQYRNLESNGHAGIDGVLLSQALAQDVGCFNRRNKAAIWSLESPDGNLKFDISNTFFAECPHVAVQDLRL